MSAAIQRGGRAEERERERENAAIARVTERAKREKEGGGERVLAARTLARALFFCVFFCVPKVARFRDIDRITSSSRGDFSGSR